MKKYLFVVILFLLVFVPIKCNAMQKIGIYDTTLKGPSEATEGESFIVEIGGIYSGLSQYSYAGEGIFAAWVEFEFDDSALEIIDRYADYYNSVVAKVDGKYYVYSEADESAYNKCLDGFLDCTPYSVKIRFFVKDTDKGEVTIKLNALKLDVFSLRADKEYDEDDMREVISTNGKTLTLKINKASSKFSVPSSIVSNKLPVVNDSALQKALKENHSTPAPVPSNEARSTSEEKSEDVVKKNTKFLKSLKVKNYKLDFKENVFKYELDLNNNVNKLKINAVSYDKKAKVKIVGASNLDKSDDTVKIRVELPTGEKAVYVIDINRSGISDSDEKLIINKLNNVVFLVVGGVFVILILVVFFHITEKRKISKFFREN